MKHLYIVLLLTFGFSQVSLEIRNVNTDAGTLDIYMTNEVEVAGFQFQLFGITIMGISGGTASENFEILEFSTSTSMILGVA